ncbi:vascular cell adhesion protein 1 isoform X2 [Hyperolius riggenbachi]|uniref:vascular cell adhesion protein 1 isoform X2 n=1 Tax=Hyperolius riggenbachi TaxID=752182 RepID=UPI0035A2CC6C
MCGKKIISITIVLGCILCSQMILSMHTFGRNITLSAPKTTVKAEIGEELNITCEAFKCGDPNPRFTWSSVLDGTMSGSSKTAGQISVLSMKIDKETDATYVCSVLCDNPPVEKRFKVLVYSLPEPILHISSRVAGKESRITCTVPDAYPPDRFQVQIWLGEKMLAEYEDADNYSDMSGPQNFSLSQNLTLADNDDGKEIKCVAQVDLSEEDEYESETLRKDSPPETLKLLFPPKEVSFTASNTEVSAGEAVTLSCSAEGDPEPRFLLYYLQSSGERILLSEGPQATLTNVSSGTYQCEATNPIGNKTEELELRVRFSPRNTLLSIDPSTVREDGKVQIGCTSEAYPAPRLVLKKKTEVGLIEIDAINGQYDILFAAEDDKGIYICEASNVLGQEEDEKTLTVQVPPRNTYISITPSSVVNAGDAVQIQCVSEAIPEPSLALKKTTEYGQKYLESVNGSYNVTAATEEDAGLYICVSTNSAGYEENMVILSVQIPPRKTHIHITPSSVVKAGDAVQIQCVSEAIPEPSLTFKKNTEYGLENLESEGGSYNITAAEEEDAGTYICVSTNAAGNEEYEVTLTVQIPPRNTHISITPSSVVKAGDAVQIQCVSEAIPEPSLIIKKKTEYGLENLESEGGSYNITAAEEEDAGMYICVSTNAAGNEEYKVTLTVQIPPRNTYISITPSSVVKAGDAVQIQCLSEAIPEPSLALKKKREHRLDDLYSKNGSYNITAVAEEDAGKYICVSSNAAGYEEFEVTLTVQKDQRQEPTFDYVPTAIIGSSALVSAGVIGFVVYRLKQAKLKGSYSLVKALGSKV